MRSFLLGIRCHMDDANPIERTQIFDLPSLLATTAARQAITPTARVQAQLMAQESQNSRSNLKTKNHYKQAADHKESQNFNYLASRILSER
ncbi:MAG: hypothetical protein ACKOAN_00115 [Chakrabartia sp.]